MIRKGCTALLMGALMIMWGCGDSGQVRPDDGPKAMPRDYNFQLIAQNIGINDPEGDVRCYYKVFIDKVEEGRTDIALDSQKKGFRAVISPNRHLLKVEKWVLDERRGTYVKPNNIDQPRPNYLYFDLRKGRTVTVDLQVDGAGKALYRITED
ncbi:MAG: hypothetical protein JXA20_18975 [Spirochaetes bacterium]|nr:hypothetical protein [Spirochaetota bacterium]